MPAAYQVCLISVVLVVISAESNTTHNYSCVGQYEQFVAKALTEDSYNQNRFVLENTFYHPNWYQPYSVEVTYQTIWPNGSRVDIATYNNNKYDYEVHVWVWLSSPIFLLSRPKFLNRACLYLLNNFREWNPPKITVLVPKPCPEVQFEFLEQMTMSIKDYAAGNTKKVKYLGNVMVKVRQYYHLPSGGDSTYYLFILLTILGNLFQLAMVWATTIVTLSGGLCGFVQQMEQQSYQHYGLACGGSAAAIILFGSMLYSTVVTFTDVSPMSNIEVTEYVLYSFYIAAATLPGIPIAVYFAYKTKPPPIPYALLLPAALLCCCKTKLARSVVFGTALWISMVAVQYLSVLVSAFIFLVIAIPLQIITNALLLLLIIFCFVNIIALCCTISAYIFTPRHRRPQGRKAIMIRAALLILLLITVTCYSSVVATSLGSYMNNTLTNEKGVLGVVGSGLVPIAIGGLTYILKQVIFKGVQNSGEDSNYNHSDMSSITETEGP